MSEQEIQKTARARRGRRNKPQSSEPANTQTHPSFGAIEDLSNAQETLTGSKPFAPPLEEKPENTKVSDPIATQVIDSPCETSAQEPEVTIEEPIEDTPAPAIDEVSEPIAAMEEEVAEDIIEEAPEEETRRPRRPRRKRPEHIPNREIETFENNHKPQTWVPSDEHDTAPVTRSAAYPKPTKKSLFERMRKAFSIWFLSSEEKSVIASNADQKKKKAESQEQEEKKQAARNRDGRKRGGRSRGQNRNPNNNANNHDEGKQPSKPRGEQTDQPQSSDGENNPRKRSRGGRRRGGRGRNRNNNQQKDSKPVGENSGE